MWKLCIDFSKYDKQKKWNIYVFFPCSIKEEILKREYYDFFSSKLTISDGKKNKNITLLTWKSYLSKTKLLHQ